LETRFSALILIAAYFVACSGAPKRAQGPDVYGPTFGNASPAPDASPIPIASYGPAKLMHQSVVLVLGPGLARGFSANGFVRKLSEEKIPVSAVVGTEVGALIAALYASAKTVNELDWKLMQFKEEAFVSPDSALGRILQRGHAGREMEAVLRKVFGKARIEQTRIPLRIGLWSETRQRFQWIDRGEIVPAVLSSIASSETYDPVSSEEGVLRAPLVERPFPVEEAKALGLGPVVVFDVFTEHSKNMTEKDESYYRKSQMAEKNALSELAQADQVIRPNMDEVGYFDFTKRNHSDFLGEQAATESVAVLRKLVGLPEEKTN
jgi:NTE family protein